MEASMASTSPNSTHKPKQPLPTAPPQKNLVPKKLQYPPLPPGLGTAGIIAMSNKALDIVYKSRPETNPMALKYQI